MWLYSSCYCNAMNLWKCILSKSMEMKFLKSSNLKNFMTPLYEWGSTVPRLDRATSRRQFTFYY